MFHFHKYVCIKTINHYDKYDKSEPKRSHMIYDIMQCTKCGKIKNNIKHDGTKGDKNGKYGYQRKV